MSDIVFQREPKTHDRPNDYEPKEPTAEELKRAGVTLIGVDSSLVYMRCDVCEQSWAAPLSPIYYVCPNARDY
jgi:hypothetical protein